MVDSSSRRERLERKREGGGEGGREREREIEEESIEGVTLKYAMHTCM